MTRSARVGSHADELYEPAEGIARKEPEIDMPISSTVSAQYRNLPAPVRESLLSLYAFCYLNYLDPHVSAP